MTDQELRLTTINLFGRLYERIRNKELLAISYYINYHRNIPPDLENKEKLEHIIYELYYHLSIDKDKGCWLPEDWSYYSKIYKIAAHRLSYRIMIGPIDAGKYICHRCDRKGCRNPFHLFMGTPSDNMRDAREKGRIHEITFNRKEFNEYKNTYTNSYLF